MEGGPPEKLFIVGIISKLLTDLVARNDAVRDRAQRVLCREPVLPLCRLSVVSMWNLIDLACAPVRAAVATRAEPSHSIPLFTTAGHLS